MANRHEGQATDDKGPTGVYGNWSAPEEDGGLLIWPDSPQIVELARRNAEFLAKSQVALGGVPLRELRSAARRLLAQQGDGPLIATGHQCELQHPGVWIKNAVICDAARASGGAALHIAVDTDAPKHLKLKWPDFSAPITDDPRANGAAWSGVLAPPTAGHLDHLMREAEAALRTNLASELLVRFLEHCRTCVVKGDEAVGPRTLPAMLLRAQQGLDRELGLEYQAIALSDLLDFEPWGHFVCSIAGDARGFAAIYNWALDLYRRGAGIDSPDRPAPDLLVTQKHVEIPFWLDHLATGRRHRAELLDTGRHLVFEIPGLPGNGRAFTFAGAAGEPSALLAWLRQNDLRLAPRALSLTMFLRLGVCDLFVHGIGGGLYDQVTDRIIRSWLGIEAPAFAVATATLFHPLAAQRERVDFAAIRQQAHKQAHEVLGADRRNWLGRIRSADDPQERRQIFEEMHQARRQAMTTDPHYIRAQQQLDAAHRRAASEAQFFDREFFYAIQPHARLHGLLDRVRQSFTRPRRAPRLATPELPPSGPGAPQFPV